MPRRGDTIEVIQYNAQRLLRGSVARNGKPGRIPSTSSKISRSLALAERAAKLGFRTTALEIRAYFLPEEGDSLALIQQQIHTTRAAKYPLSRLVTRFTLFDWCIDELPDQRKLKSERELLGHLKNFYAAHASKGVAGEKDGEGYRAKMRKWEEAVGKQEGWVAELEEKCAGGKEVQRELREEIRALEADNQRVEEWARGSLLERWVSCVLYGGVKAQGILSTGYLLADSGSNKTFSGLSLLQ